MPELNVGRPEVETQNRIIRLFSKQLGYSYLGNWEEGRENSNIEEVYLRKYLQKQGYNDDLIGKALFELLKVARNQNKTLYDINKEVYSLIRYGIQVKENLGEPNKTVNLIDWKNPENNTF
jgi:type I restriction enzyme, R subunit